MSWNEKSGYEICFIRMFCQFFSHRFKEGMEVVLVAGRFWPPSWTGCFLVRKAVRTTYQFLLREMDIFVRQICFADGNSTIAWESRRSGTHSLTRIKNNLRPQGKSRQQISHLNTERKCFKMVALCENRQNQRINWRKKSALTPAVQNRMFFFYFELQTILWKNNTEGIQKENKWRRRWDGGGYISPLLAVRHSHTLGRY